MRVCVVSGIVDQICCNAVCFAFPFCKSKLFKISCILANAEQLGQLAQLLWDMKMTAVFIGNGVTDKAKVDNA